MREIYTQTQMTHDLARIAQTHVDQARGYTPEEGPKNVYTTTLPDGRIITLQDPSYDHYFKHYGTFVMVFGAIHDPDGQSRPFEIKVNPQTFSAVTMHRGLHPDETMPPHVEKAAGEIARDFIAKHSERLETTKKIAKALWAALETVES